MSLSFRIRNNKPINYCRRRNFPWAFNLRLNGLAFIPHRRPSFLHDGLALRSPLLQLMRKRIRLESLQ
jgi:hypothetical protein